MISKEKISDTLIKEAIKYILVLALMPLVFIWEPIKSKLIIYDPILLYSSLVLFLVIGFGDIFFSAYYKDKQGIICKTIIYGLSFLIFLTLALLQSSKSVIYWPYILSFSFLLLSRQVIESWIQRIIFHKKESLKSLGYAATGILIERIGDNINFIVLLNKNLRHGEGLWVPPGGHFIPHLDNPEIKVKQKIREELGVECHLLKLENQLPLVEHDRKNKEVEWIVPPVFLMKELLPGKCRQNHSCHFDLIYICLTDGTKKNDKPKYKETDIIKVPLGECLTSYEATEQALKTQIITWQRNRGLELDARNDSYSSDLVWRLNLAATIYANNNEFQ